MILLINKTDIAEYRQISSTALDQTVNSFIQEAQFTDLQKLLGSDFYNDLIRNYTDTKYQTLLDGGDYTYNGTTYTNVGLKTVLIHYFYARYVMFGDKTDTPFGFVEKLNDTSQSATLADKKSIAKNSETLAFNYWENVLRFLDRNQSDYPLFKCDSRFNRNRRMKIYKVG